MKSLFSFLFLISTLTKFSYGDDRCQLPIDPGRCLADVPSYGYDTKIGKCVRFTYGGCGGNDNIFFHKKDCKNTCVYKIFHPEIKIDDYIVY